MKADFLEGVSAYCPRCRYTVALAPPHPLHPLQAPVADMPDIFCRTCGRSMVINWRDVEVEELETVA